MPTTLPSPILPGKEGTTVNQRGSASTLRAASQSVLESPVLVKSSDTSGTTNKPQRDMTLATSSNPTFSGNNHNVMAPANNSSSSPIITSPAPKSRKRLFDFSARQEEYDRQAELSAGRPDNLFSRKFWVIFVFALIIWAYYVFVGRVCVPMIRIRPGNGGSKGEGIGLLIGFNILWLMFVWSYLKMILTSPGYAKDLVEKVDEGQIGKEGEERQMVPQQVWYYPGQGRDIGNYAGIGGGSRAGQGRVEYLGSGTMPGQEEGPGRTDQEERSSIRPSTPAQRYARSVQQRDEREEVDDTYDPGTLDGPYNLLPAEVTSTVLTPIQSSTSHPDQNANPIFHSDHPSTSPLAVTDSEPLYYRPLPPFHPNLSYCNYCKIYKPHRTHHCRHCGTCVLGMDHHCPWVGGCVGWGNHKVSFVMGIILHSLRG